jgi:hypothetical protein
VSELVNSDACPRCSNKVTASLGRFGTVWNGLEQVVGDLICCKTALRARGTGDGEFLCRDGESRHFSGFRPGEVAVRLGRIVALHHRPSTRTYSVPLFLKRQCDRTLGGRSHAAGVRRGQGAVLRPR